MSNDSHNRPILLGRSLAALHADADRAGHKGLRARQLFGWLYRQKVRSIDEPSNLPNDYRQWVREYYRWGGGELVDVRRSLDGSRKFAFQLDDGRRVEGILMPDKNRLTLCLSTQVGCPLGCRFCLTGLMGLERQLRADEIIDQVRAAQVRLLDEGEELTNIVFMGMGEPLLNPDSLFPALELLTSPQAFAISSRRITVSTAGHVPGIEKLGAFTPQVNLAVSLNAGDDQTRGSLMPINRRWPLGELLEACRRFPLKQRRRVTFEYVMLAGVNDAPEHARALSRLVHGIPCKINLIPWNPDPRLPFERPSLERIERFQDILLAKHHSVFIRASKGLDVSGACGQLITATRTRPAGEFSPPAGATQVWNIP